MTYNFDTKLATKNFTVEIDTAENYGYFEHHELGDECGGGLWFETHINAETPKAKKLELIDYDGVSELALEIVTILRAAGFIVGEEFE